MSDTAERILIVIALMIFIGVHAVINKSHHKDTQSQLAAYQDSVNVLTAENKKLHAAQTMYSDAIVFSVGIKPMDFKELRQQYEDAVKKATASIENYRKFMALQEVNHGKEN